MADIIIDFSLSEEPHYDNTTINNSTIVYLQPSSLSTGDEPSSSEYSAAHHSATEYHRGKFKHIKRWMFLFILIPIAVKQTNAEFFLSHIPMGGEGEIHGFNCSKAVGS